MTTHFRTLFASLLIVAVLLGSTQVTALAAPTLTAEPPQAQVVNNPFLSQLSSIFGLNKAVGAWRKVFGAGEVSLVAGASTGSTYYIDAVNGNDSNNGLSEATAWKTSVKAFVFQDTVGFNPGDQILFKRGQEYWHGQWGQTVPVWKKSSGTSDNHIVIGAYGEGAKPIIRFAKPRVTEFDIDNVEAEFAPTETPGVWVAELGTLEPFYVWENDYPLVKAPDLPTLLDPSSNTNWWTTNNTGSVTEQLYYRPSSGVPADHAVLPTRVYRFQFEDVSHITIQDLHFRNGETPIHFTAKTSDITDNYILNNDFFAVNIGTYFGTPTTYKNYNSKFNNNYQQYVRSSVMFYAQEANVGYHFGAEVAHNVLEDSNDMPAPYSGWGGDQENLYWQNINNFHIHHNTVKGGVTTGSSNWWGPYNSSTGVGYGSNKNNIWEFNIFLDIEGASSIGLGGHTQLDFCYDNVIRYNILEGGTTPLRINHCYTTDQTRKSHAYNNTVTEGPALLSMVGRDDWSFHNNIYANPKNTENPQNELFIVSYSTTFGHASDHNLYYASKGDAGMFKRSAQWGNYWTTGITYDLAGWQAYQNRDLSSIVADPRFIGGTDAEKYAIDWDSSAIDAGAPDSLLKNPPSQDLFGNPIYGIRDIGAIEYQPPYTMGTDLVDLAADVRLYGDGKFRNTKAPSGTSAELSIIPTSGDTREWMDVSISTWGATKTWTEITANVTGTVAHTVGDLTPGTTYTVAYAKEGSATTTLGTFTANGEGAISFTYEGGYSTVTFTVEEAGTQAPTPTVSLNASPTTIESGQSSTLSWSSSNTSSCLASDFSASGTSGSAVVSPTETTTYSIACTGDGGTASDSATVTVTAPQDTTPPSITNVAAGNIQQSSATITWTTDEPATSQVAYGISQSYTNTTTETQTLTTSHSVTLTNLAPGTLYHFSVRSRDAAGNSAASANQTFSTLNAPDTTPPTVSITTPANGATVQGTISITANATDPTVAGQTTSGVAGVQFKVNGANLGTEDTTSPYTVGLDTATLANGSHTLTAVARDHAGNTATSPSISITVDNPVTPPADTTPPTLSNITVSDMGGSYSDIRWRVTWNTNEPATSKVEYGTSAGTLSNTVSATTLTESHALELPFLSNKTTYYYRVSSTDAAGNTAVSSTLSFKTSGRPSKVQNLTAKSGSVILSWDTHPEADSLIIVRKNGSSVAATTDTPLATLAGSATTYTDQTARDNTPYTYTVFATKDGEFSDPASVSFTKRTDRPTVTGGGSSGGGGSASTPGAAPTLPAAACHRFKSGDAIPAGFGLPYNPQTNELLISVTCGTTSTMTVGTDNPNLLIYRYGYEWTGTTWRVVTLTGTAAQGDWLTGKAAATLSRPSGYVVAYTCEYRANRWQCGCQDAACAQPAWQVQGY